jgi:hypothetical protein
MLAWLTLAAPAPAQVTTSDDKAVLARIDEIDRDIAAAAVDAAVEKIAGEMKSRSPSENLRANFQVLKTFGKAQYVDRVYARDYGRTTKDFIEKINFDRAILYVRYIYTVEQGEWRLIQFNFKTEANAPFPRDWVHIYP